MQTIPKSLEQDLLDLIQAAPNGLPEHQLLKQLCELDYPSFCPSFEPLALFQAHFLLFHLLYRLAEDWRHQGHGELQIDCLNICFKPVQTTSGSDVARQDSLKSYYLDYRHYRDTQTEDVIELLDNFWKQIGQIYPENEVQQAKQQLGFEADEPLNRLVIQQRFRQLSQQHHPDKGGSTETFQQLNQANQLLKRAYPN